MNTIVGLMRIGSMSEEELYQFIEGCLSLGLDWFDLADIYCKSNAEKMVGNVLAAHPGLRERMHIQTKVGITLKTKGYDSSYEYIMEAAQACLDRLQTDHVDRLLIHRPDIFMDNEEIGRAFSDLKKQGKVLRFGVSNFSSSEIRYLQKGLPKDIVLDCNQVSLSLGNTTMIDQTMLTNVPRDLASKEADDLFFFMKTEDIALQCWSPFQYGYFAGSIFDEEKYPQIALPLKKYAEKYQTSPCAIASAFLHRLGKSVTVITGSVNLKHIQQALEGENIPLTKADWYSLYAETGHRLP